MSRTRQSIIMSVLMSLLPVLVFAAPPAVLTWEAGDGGAGVTSQTTYFGSAVASGDAILTCGHWGPTTAVATVTDTVGNTYTPVWAEPIRMPNGSTQTAQCFLATNITGTSNDFGVRWNYSQPTVGFSLVNAVSFSGVDPIDPIDTYATNTGSGTTLTSGTIRRTRYPAEMLIGFFMADSYVTPWTTGSGYTQGGYDASTLFEYRSVPFLAGPTSASASSGASANWVGTIIALRGTGECDDDRFFHSQKPHWDYTDIPISAIKEVFRRLDMDEDDF